jgi:hypothetical protein
MARGTLGLLLAAAAAYGYYRYTKMTPQQKNDLRTKGKDFVDKNLGGLKNVFTRERASAGAGANGNY